MKGHEKVIERLNEALFLELGAVNQYWLHYRLTEDWGFTKFAQKEREESIEEMGHVDKLVKRIVFLEGHPNLQTLSPLRIGQNIKEVLECDHITKKLFDELLEDEEGHIDFLETQLALLEKIGEEKYGQLNAASAEKAE